MTAGPTYRTRAETATTDGPVIYVVDDDNAVRVALGSLMRSMGFRVEVSSPLTNFCYSRTQSGQAASSSMCGCAERAAWLFIRKT